MFIRVTGEEVLRKGREACVMDASLSLIINNFFLFYIVAVVDILYSCYKASDNRKWKVLQH